MAIGDKTVNTGTLPTSAGRGAAVHTAFRGLASAIGDVANVTTALAAEEENSAKRHESFLAETAFAKRQGEWARGQLDAVNEAKSDGTGLTETRNNYLRQSAEEFVSTLPDWLQDEYTARTTQATEALVTDIYVKERALRNEYQRSAIGITVNELSSDIAEGHADSDTAFAQLEAAVDKMEVQAAEKEEILRQGKYSFLTAEFSTKVQEALAYSPPPLAFKTNDIALPGATPAERGFLNATSAKESTGYDIRYDGTKTGAKFTDFSQHPGIGVPVPLDLDHYTQGNLDAVKAGIRDPNKSTAAGRYQFTITTWNEVAKELNLQDFSPANQDRAALYLAEKRYNAAKQEVERPFDELMLNGTDEELLRMKKSLENTWAGFKKLKDPEFLNIFRGELGEAGGGAPIPEAPDIWTDERYQDLPYDVKKDLAVAAKQVETKRKAADEQAKTEAADIAKAALATGEWGEKEIVEGITSGKFNVSDWDDLLKLVSTERDRRQEATRYQKAVQNGTILADTKENRDAAMAYYEKAGLYQGLKDKDQEAGGIIARDFINTAIMPKEIKDTLNGLVNSADASEVHYAMNMLTTMRTASRAQFESGMSEELVEAANFWDQAVRYSPSGDMNAIASKFASFRSPEMRELRKGMQDDINTSLVEITNDDIIASFRGNFFARQGAYLIGEQIDLPENPQTLALFQSDFSKLYRHYYPLFQDKDKTVEMVSQQMQYHWQPETYSGENRLMYHPPTSPAAGYLPLNESYSWIEDDVRIGLNLEDDEHFALIADAQTERDIAAGVQASYTVVVRRDNEYELQLDSSGNPMHLRFEQPQELHDQTKSIQASSNVARQIRDLRAQREKIAVDNVVRDSELREELSGSKIIGRSAQERIDEIDEKLQRLDQIQLELFGKIDEFPNGLEYLRKEKRLFVEKRDKEPFGSEQYKYYQQQIDDVDVRLNTAWSGK